MNTADQSALRNFAGREAKLVEQAMQGDLAEALQGCDPLLAEVIDYALFGGGKRIRPRLAILAARLCGSAASGLYSLAAAFEYLHVATLIHDDVIDNAQARRGRAAVGRKYGTAPAILAGDWLHARSLYLVGRFAGPEGLAVFCRSTTGMVDGEFLQLSHVADSTLTEEQYFAIILRKTALLISSTCEIGAIFAGASAERRAALAEYGSKLGTAFQVIDDLLDYQGDAGSTGKQTGNDFIEGKLTLPLLRALARAEAPARAVIAALFALHKLGRDISTRDLRKHRHIVVRDSSSRRDKRAQTIEAEQRWTVTNMSTSIGAVSRGHGFAWLPEDKVRTELSQGALKVLPLREGRERIEQLYLLFADRDAAGPGSLRLAQIIKEEVGRQMGTA